MFKPQSPSEYSPIDATNLSRLSTDQNSFEFVNFDAF